MAQQSFSEGGLSFGAVRVSTGHDAPQRVKKYPRWLFVLINLLLALLACVAILFSLYFSDLFAFHSYGGDVCNVAYSLELFDASGILDAASLEGVSVLDVESGTVIGTVQSVSLRSASVLLPEFKTGDASTLDTGGQIVTLTVLATANYRQGNGYYIEGIRLAMNADYYVTVGEYTGQGSCVTLTKTTGEESGS
jgi:hypothetical protein